MTKQQMPITRVDLAERGHDAYVSAALDQHIFNLTDWIDLPKDHQQAFRAGVDAILDVLIAEAARLCQDNHNQIDIRLDSGSYETLADWLRSFKEEA